MTTEKDKPPTKTKAELAAQKKAVSRFKAALGTMAVGLIWLSLALMATSAHRYLLATIFLLAAALSFFAAVLFNRSPKGDKK